MICVRHNYCCVAYIGTKNTIVIIIIISLVDIISADTAATPGVHAFLKVPTNT